MLAFWYIFIVWRLNSPRMCLESSSFEVGATSKNGSDVFYHRFGNGIPGYTTRAPPYTCAAGLELTIKQSNVLCCATAKRHFFWHDTIIWQLIFYLTRKRAVNDFNHGGDIRTATCRCVLCSIIFQIDVVVQFIVFHIEVVVKGNFQSKVLLRKRNLMRWELPLPAHALGVTPRS